MTGGLLQLVAIGIDSIFLTSNPSITLFKCVYRRHSNFSLTQRTKQILNISNFGENGQYQFQKEGDLIHKVWFNVKISNFLLRYPLPTKENISKILLKYGLNIDIPDNITINIEYYKNNIIPKILQQITQYVDTFNIYDTYIQDMIKFLDQYNFNINKSNIYSDKNILVELIQDVNQFTSINKLLIDLYNSFNNFNQINSATALIDILYLIIVANFNDLNSNNDIKINQYKDVLDKLTYQNIIFLTETIITYIIKNTSIDYPDSSFYNSFKLLYIFQKSLDNNILNEYNGYTYLDYFNSQIQKYLDNLEFNININNYQYLENYITLTKFLLNNNNVILNKNFTDEFKNQMMNTLIYNSFNNIDIIYNVILNTMINNNTHNNYNNYCVGYFKTFTNSLSDTVIFTSLLGNNIYGLNDNLLNLFTKYNNSKQLYQIYFANEIIQNINNINLLIKQAYDVEIFADYFSDINIWNKIPLGSNSTQNLLTNLKILTNGNTYGITNDKYIYSNGSYSLNVNPSPDDIYNKYINNLDQNILDNLYLLNYTPLHTIRDIATEIYNEFSSDNYIQYDKSFFDYRDFDQFDPINYPIINPLIFNPRENININQTVKNNLYQQFIFNILLQRNKTNDTINIYNNFSIFNQTYITNFTSNFINDNRIAITGLFQPENLFIFNDGNKNFKLPPIIAIIETFRYNIITNINNYYSNNIIIGVENKLDYVYTKLDNILSRYNIFKNANNLTDNIYSYSSYINNGRTFLNIETNITPQPVTNINYIQAASSIWSYIYQIMIRSYNSLFNNILISENYYANNLGLNYVASYDTIFSGLNEPQKLNIPYIYAINIDDLKNLYSYKLSYTGIDSPPPISQTIYFYDENSNTDYPIDLFNVICFDYYSFGDILQFSQNPQNPPDVTYLDLSYILNSNTITPIITSITDYESLDSELDLLQNNNVITTLDLQYLYQKLKLGFNIDSDSVDYKKLNNSYKSSVIDLTNINIPFNPQLILSELITSVKNTFVNLNSPNTNIKNNISLSQSEFPIFGDILQNIFNYITQYNSNPNPFNQQTQKNSYNTYNELYTLYSENISELENFINLLQDYIIDNFLPKLLNNPYILSLYNNFLNLSDILNFIINTIISESEYNFIYKFINFDKKKMVVDIFNYLIQEKYKYMNLILNLTIQTDTATNPQITEKQIDIFGTFGEITIDTPFINFKEYIPYLELLYMQPQLFKSQTDIIYYGSELDLLMRNIILQNPVPHCWVPELGYAMFQDLTFNLDQLLIDEYDSNLMNLLKKIEIPYDQYGGLDKLIGNTPELYTYNTLPKGNLNLFIPLNFYFCKESRLSIPMINLLYTPAMIKFTLKALNQLLIYDKNAEIIVTPKLKCNMLVQYIYLEDDERKKIAKSKMEFLIEKYKYAGTFSYNYTNLIENSFLRTKLRIADPTKYILWRFRVRYENKDEDAYKWNINGYFDSNGDQIRTTDFIKIYFNGQIREQGFPEKFNTIINYGRLLGSINPDEYLYSFALYPLMYQPSGAANLSQIEDVVIEHQLNPIFIDLMISKNLTIDIEYWGFGYNVIRMISGLGAPLFYY
jgi:hypothetical protein